MKIAFLSCYSGEVYRGVETFVHELANRLVDFGHDVTVFQNGEVLSHSRYMSIPMKVAKDSNAKGSYLPYVNYYARFVKKFTEESLKKLPSDTEIIFPTNGQWQSLLCKAWAAKNKKKVVISGQSGPGIDDRLNLITFPDTFVGMTDYQVAWAKRANPFVKVAKIPNGVDLDKFAKNVKPMKLDLPGPIILCVAAFDFWKRLDLVIKAVSNLQEGSLLLVGSGKEENKLRSLGEKLLPGRFKIVSFPHDKMPAVYASADLFTYATVPWESFGIVLVEAMATGLGIVATDDPIRREIVGDAGLFVDPTDTDEYAKKLREALATNWGEKPRSQAEKFSWDEIAKKYDKLFESLV